MAINADVLNRLVPISQFNKGQAAQVFERLQQEPRLIVLKNNVPAAVMLSPSEFSRMVEIEENYRLLLEAQKRHEGNNFANAIDEALVLKNNGLSEADIAAAEDVEIEYHEAEKRRTKYDL